MKTKVLFMMLALCLLLVSCGSKTHDKQTIKEIAHSHNCITMDEFCELKYSYVFEKKLPCLVYLDELHVSDIVSNIDDLRYVVGDSDEEDEENYVYVDPCWIGEPTKRNNECWIKSWIAFRQYIGLDKTQVEWVLSKTKSSRTIYTPIIIKIYQVGCSPETFSGSFISYKADLVAILNEE